MAIPAVMIVPVLWVSTRPEILARGYADEGLLEAIFDGSLWSPPGALTFEHHEVRGDFPDVDGAVVVLPARHHDAPDTVAWFKAQLDRLAWSVVVLAGDEDWSFPWAAIPETPTRKVWIMQPRPEHQHLSGLIPGGWYPGTREALVGCEHDTRPLDWFFAGQVNHVRRDECAFALRAMGGGLLHETEGYLQGMPQADYMRNLAAAKVIPCPSGPYTLDTARPLEAMEAGCVPVIDMLKPRDPQFDYFSFLFRGPDPLPRITDWADFPAVCRHALRDWPANANAISAFWQGWKRKIAHQLHDDVRAVSGVGASALGGDESRQERRSILAPAPDDLITVVITTSPAPLHPSTEHIEAVIDSVRAQLPLAEIIIVADGVRVEQEHRRADYEEYLRRLFWLTNFRWRNVVPVRLEEWQHQANATRAALDLVTTPLVLFVEHDTPLEGEIDWLGLCAFVRTGEANAVRLHFDVTIHPEHEALMLDHETQLRGGHGHYNQYAAGEQPAIGTVDWVWDEKPVPVRRTAVWWQRPHLASARFYRECIMARFNAESRCFIEDAIYGLAVSAYMDHGESGWYDWRVWVYTPEPNMKRSGHLDSRGAEEKYPQILPGP